MVAPPPFLFPASRPVRIPSELGRDAATCVAKTGAAVKVGNSFRLNSAAPVFRLAAGVSPSNQETDKPAHPKPVSRRASRTPARASPSATRFARGIFGRPTLRFGYSRANRDSEGHLQGRPARSARIVPPPVTARGDDTSTGWTAGAARSVLVARGWTGRTAGQGVWGGAPGIQRLDAGISVVLRHIGSNYIKIRL